MRVFLKELLDKLAVNRTLSAYETNPWSAFDDEKGITFSAEVRMNGDGKELEAEIQIMRDNPTGDEKPFEQLFWLICTPAVNEKWDFKSFKLKGEPLKDPPYGWEDKGCQLFSACVQEINMGKVPDFDALMEKHMKDNAKFGGRQGGGGGKGLKVQNKPAQKMAMKGGM